MKSALLAEKSTSPILSDMAFVEPCAWSYNPLSLGTVCVSESYGNHFALGVMFMQGIQHLRKDGCVLYRSCSCIVHCHLMGRSLRAFVSC